MTFLKKIISLTIIKFSLAQIKAGREFAYNALEKTNFPSKQACFGH